MKPQNALIYLLLSLGVFALDWITKILVLIHFELYESVEILPIFNLTYVRNFGASFSFLANQSGWQQWLFISLALAVCLYLTYCLANNARALWKQNTGYALIIGGAIGNGLDRLYHGFVVDFLDFHYQQWHYPVFNVADIAICLGAALLIWDSFTTDKKNTMEEQTDENITR